MTRAHWGAIALLILIPLLANAGLLSGWSNCDPELIYGQFNLASTPGILPGTACFVDPAVAVITYPLGRLSAHDWLHGIIPWWNPYNGVGMPLAAEMQNESFFLPFVLLLHFHQGWFIQRLLFQILSGLFTYAFLVELSLSSGAAFLGGSLFSLNATFILTAGPVSGPILFLPLMLLGIEHARRAATATRPMGWSLVTLGLAGSLYAGFPETAYIDGLLCACWSALRLFQLRGAARWSLVGKLVLAAGVALGLAAPLTLPFLDYLRAGAIGGHSGQLPNGSLPAAAAPISLLPLAYGALAMRPPSSIAAPLHDMWVRIGGWYGCAPVFLAFYALVPKPRLQPERILLAAWAGLWQARFFGAPGLIAAIGLVPGMNVTDSVRYAPLSVEFAVFALAAFGLDDCLKRQPRPRAHLLWPALAFAACLAASVIPAAPILKLWFSFHPELPAWSALQPPLRAMAFVSGALSAATLAALIISIQLRRYLWLAPGLMVLGSVAVYLLPQLCAPRSIQPDQAVIPFLRNQPGIWRYYTTAPLGPNFGAGDLIASINDVQLPAPGLWQAYIAKKLFPGGDGILFGGFQPGQMEALETNLPAYEDAGVKYVLALPYAGTFLHTISPPMGASLTTATQLRGGQSLSGIINPLAWPAQGIFGVTITLGTFGGGASGPLAVTLCAGARCVTGTADLATAIDNNPFYISLPGPFTLPSGAPLTYRFSHLFGRPVAIWLVNDQGVSQSVMASTGPMPGLAPNLALQISAPAVSPAPVYGSPAVAIYQLPHPAPYAETSGPCSLQILSRQSMRAHCAKPATLLRRELYYPGWRATIAGTPVPITQAGIFQRIQLPAGLSDIGFSYMPPGTPRNCTLALVAAFVWLGCAASRRRSMHIKR